MTKRITNGKKRTPKSPNESTKRRFKITEILTLVIAIWGAALSSWIYVEQSKEATPRIYVRMDVQAVGYDKDNKPVGDIQVLFSNVGKSTISIAPRLDILSVDGRSGKAIIAEASFFRKSVNNARIYNAALPVTLKPGEEAIASSVKINLMEMVDPLDYYSVQFDLSDGSRYSLFISEVETISKDRTTNREAGWSAGGLASKIR